MLPLPLRIEETIERQRDRHFRRRRKVFGQFFTPSRLAAWMVETAVAVLRRIVIYFTHTGSTDDRSLPASPTGCS